MRPDILDRLVIDTNVVVSAAISDNFTELVDLHAEYDIDIYTCAQQLIELKRTLLLPKVLKKLPALPVVFVKIYQDLTQNVIVDERFDRSPDPDDNYLFDLAYTVKSYYLVTGEKALLNMKKVNEINIISMAELRRLLKK